ncbi:hypothetical protein MHU86_4431 [Fragilaria crotonensis]|nr:hypothetical protein MHU86_4431 [Fragilaria crotonensis]
MPLQLLLLVVVVFPITSFLINPSPSTFLQRSATSLYDGKGVAQTYSWVEDALELEIRVPVPRDTRAKDIIFECRPRGVTLKVMTKSQGGDDKQELVLMQGNRTMRGTIAMDGTFWNLEDQDDNTVDTTGRHVVVTIEKQIRPARDDFEVVDYDWGGVYPDDDDEVLERTYLEPEMLNLKEYAASLGVDIDNIDMSLVNKTMFTSGLNITQSTLHELEKKGLVKEVTQQGDGSEYIVDDDGESVPFASYGTGVSREEIKEATKINQPPIPFLDTDSPWKAKQPAALDIDDMLKDVVPLDREDKTVTAVEDVQNDGRIARNDPIGALTVNRLKQILREQGLKVTGNKEELQQRLRSHVQSQLK